MCGIAGMVGGADEAVVARMCSAMVHRGPDDAGMWVDQAAGVALGHRRLAVVDLSSAGHQPMHSDDGSLILSYNGEIYNFREERVALEREGVQFRTRTDTEVLLKLYERYGVGCLSRLNGMFAFALWDRRQQKLILARDHAGVKPLYYWQGGGRLAFASEIKALRVVPGVPRRLNHSALHAYLGFLWVPGQETMLQEVFKLEPGHVLEWHAGVTAVRRWFRLDWQPDAGTSEADWVRQVREAVIRATRRQMVSDVPLGAFLSGGLDSSSIVACMRQAHPERRIDAYTAAFEPGQMAEDQGVDDLPYARQAARYLGATLHEVPIAPDVVSLLPRMVHHLDEPDADPAVFPSYLLAEAARRAGRTVLLSGTGGDEVFFGYRSHLALYRLAAFHTNGTGVARGAMWLAAAASGWLLGPRHRFSRRSRKLLRTLFSRNALDRHVELVDWSDDATRARVTGSGARPNGRREESLRDFLVPYAREFSGRGELNLHSHLLINTFLAAHNFLYTDKSSMAASIEVRVPFMDVDLMRLGARIPERQKMLGGVSKYVLKEAMAPLLPADLIHRRKTGFGVPLRKWLRNDLRGLSRQLLSPESVRRRGVFAADGVSALVAENEAGQADHAYLIYALMVFELWAISFLDS